MLWVMPVVLNKTQWIYPVGAGARRSFGVPGGPISPPVPLALNPLGGRFRRGYSYLFVSLDIQCLNPVGWAGSGWVVLHHTSGGTFGPDRLKVHQTLLHGGSSVESGFEPGTFRPQGRDLTTWPLRPKSCLNALI
ncbi:hypothetical protein AVEN_106715-1 [Araneus ventricosus]|uniref:Uncharacterized protein n=1 Tax=Araneus ventricosus TaxID=182803 RepID=A0A4Y2F2D6_ARAVE|nr:hypothetical protein AVEN_106715-1 [Araneus ventricosus]